MNESKNKVLAKFEKKSRKNKGKRSGVQYVVSSTARNSQPQTDNVNDLQMISEGSMDSMDGLQ